MSETKVCKSSSSSRKDDAAVRRSSRPRRGVAPERFSPSKTKSVRSIRATRGGDDDEDDDRPSRQKARVAAKKAKGKRKTSEQESDDSDEDVQESKDEEESSEEEGSEKQDSGEESSQDEEDEVNDDDDEEEDEKSSVTKVQPEPRVPLTQMTVPQLQKLLRHNHQLLKGNKPELIKRVKDCVKNGGLPMCPKKRCAQLRKTGRGMHSRYYCPGSMDGGHYSKCDYTAKECERVSWTWPA